MGMVRLILPYLLVLFFLYKANRQPLFLLGIPFLMFMSNSIFFENAKPFQIPGSIYYQLLFMWLILSWLLSKTFSKNKLERINGNHLNFLDILVIVMIVITIIGLARAIIGYYPITSGIWEEFWIEISLFAGYFIIKNWVSTNNPEVVVDFLYSLVLVNSIAACLFILHQGLHLTIYIGEEYMSDTFQGQEITRSFWFMPPFPFFSVAFLLVFTKRYSIISIALLLVNLLAIIITYTLSSLIIAILILIIYFVLSGLKNGRLTTAVKNMLVYALLGMTGVFIMSRFMPANTNYLLSRIEEQTKSQYTQKEPNDLDVRFTNTANVISQIDGDKKLLGMGPVTKLQATKVVEMQANTADITWSGIIFRWGFIGLLIVILIYGFSLFHAFNFFLKSAGVVSDLALLVLLVIISQFIESFVSWTFLSGHGLATGMWYFAVLSALFIFDRKSKSSADKIVYAPSLSSLIFGK